MQENPDINKPLDLKDIQKLLIDKSNIGTPIPVSYDKYKFKKYNLINPPLRSVRILNSYTVKYFSQTYLLPKEGYLMLLHINLVHRTFFLLYNQGNKQKKPVYCSDL